jgi:predicted ribosome quality control (RQC) complex YloA/Tae2 family protein
MEVKHMESSDENSSTDRLALCHKAVAKALKSLNKKLEKQVAELQETERAAWYRRMADTLMAYPDNAPRGAVTATILDVHTQKEETIALNPKFDSRGNAELLYKKARKAERGGAINAQKVAETKAEIDTAENLLQSCKQIQDGSGSDDLFGALESFLKKHAPKDVPHFSDVGDQVEKTPYRHFSMDDGWNVYIGRNDRQNDELTTRFTKLSDLWLHVAGHPGSHVVIRRPDKTVQVPPAILKMAASLAVWFSRAKHTSFVDVHYTEARYVRKRRHSPPGEVVLERYKSIRVSPKSPHELFPSKYGEIEE